MTDRDLPLETLLEHFPYDRELWNVSASAADETEERELRAWVELTGLLAADCDDEPPEGARERMLSRLSAERGFGSGADVLPWAGSAESDPSPQAAPPRPGRFVPLALAAALAVCLIGIAFLAGRVLEQGQRIAGLQARAAVPAETGAVAARARAVEGEIQRLRQRLRMVTSVARYAYPLQATASSRGEKPLDGVVYVCGSHQRWYLSLRGLEPPPEDREYHLWFQTADGPRDGGRLEVRPGEPVELEASTLPPETHGFSVTLEPLVAEAGAPEGPLGETVLLSEDSVSL